MDREEKEKNTNKIVSVIYPEKLMEKSKSPVR